MSRITLVFGGAALALATQLSHAITTLPQPPSPPNPPDPGVIITPVPVPNPPPVRKPTLPPAPTPPDPGTISLPVPDLGSIPVPTPPDPGTISLPVPDLGSIPLPTPPDPGTISLPVPDLGGIPLPTPPDPGTISLPVPDAGSIPLPTPPQPPNPPNPHYLPMVYQPPTVYDSYHVMCEQGGLQFALGGGLLYLDPDTLQITSVAEQSLRSTPLGPYVQGVDIPDRYQAANCSSDGGRTWGRVILDFYLPNYGESSLVHTGVEDLVLGEQRSDQHQEIPADQEPDLNALMQALQDLIGGGYQPPAVGLEAPIVPTLPSPFYTIDVSYRGPGGQVLSVSAPGVIGVPSIVPIENVNNLAPESLVVQVGPSQTTQADGTALSSGYQLTIQRVSASATATCSPLKADVKVRLGIASPTDPGYPTSTKGTFELGYTTINTASSTGAPSSFTVKYESSTASTGPTRNDFVVDVTQVPSCGSADAIDIVGHFKDEGEAGRSDDDVDLALDLAMPTGTNWTLRRKTDANYRMMVTSTSPAPLGTLALKGVNKGKTLSATVGSIPESLTVCTHKGNLCNEAWRLDRNSEISFYIQPRDANDKPARMTVAYSESGFGDSLDVSLWLSHLAYDSYIGRFGLSELPLGPAGSGGDYPKWFQIDTMGTPIGGTYQSRSGSHWLNINLGNGTRIWNREVVADKKWHGFKIGIDFWGYISCSGFSVDIDSAGKLGSYLLGQALCRG